MYDFKRLAERSFMEFTYDSYRKLLGLLKKSGYQATDYKNWEGYPKAVILRHDIDMSLQKALKIAQIEAEENVKSIFFILVSTDFYNIHSKKSYEIIRKIQNLGAEIGLHFDETRYAVTKHFELIPYIENEALILENAIGVPVKAVSMHRPSKGLLESNLVIPGLVNSYSNTFFNQFKYISDSRGLWHENIEEVIEKNDYPYLHILTHAFWYDSEVVSVHDHLLRYIQSAVIERYESLDNNIRDFGMLVNKKEIN